MQYLEEWSRSAFVVFLHRWEVRNACGGGAGLQVRNACGGGAGLQTAEAGQNCFGWGQALEGRVPAGVVEGCWL